jgi:biotin transport system substrate-specific component
MNPASMAQRSLHHVLSRLTIRHALALASGVAVMTLSAKIQIPFWPVPMTLHTLTVMALAVALGPVAAVSVMAAYLVVGALGLPVFSGSPARGIGLAYMIGPTGGYLLGYLIASGLVGRWAAGRKTLGRIAAMLAGLVPIYGLGLAWLSLFLPAHQLIALGALPFLLGDLLKIGVVAAGVAVLSRTGLALRLKAFMRSNP